MTTPRPPRPFVLTGGSARAAGLNLAPFTGLKGFVTVFVPQFHPTLGRVSPRPSAQNRERLRPCRVGSLQIPDLQSEAKAITRTSGLDFLTNRPATPSAEDAA